MKAVSGKHFCKILRKNGWTLRSIHGSHHNYSPPPDSDHTTVSVPVHANKDLGTGMQRALMKKTGIVESDL